MPWEISWAEGTRGLVATAARQMFPTFPATQDIGRLAIEKIEEEVRLYPLPSPDLPQFSREELFSLGRVQVLYHINSAAGRAEVRKVTVF
jgi:hypothetical protein